MFKRLFSNIWLIMVVALIGIFTSCQKTKPEQQVFYYNESRSLSTLDPAFARNMTIINACLSIYNGLTQLDEHMQVMPSLAKSWIISADGLKYTFRLRNDVFFHDNPCFKKGQGRRLVASDVVYSFKRLVDPNIAAPGAWALERMRVCYASNDSTFVLELKEYYPVLLQILANPYCFIVPEEAVQYYGKNFRANPVGTGPFVFKIWREGERLILRRNPKYFERDEYGNRLPYLEAVNVSFIVDKQAEFLEFMSGRLNYLSGVYSATKDELLTKTGDLRKKHFGKIRMQKGEYFNTEYLGFAMEKGSSYALKGLQDKRVRKAIAYGIDRTKILKYLRNNVGQPAQSGFVPIGMPGYDSTLIGYSFNPQLSRKLLAQAGYANGNGLPEITISTTADYLDYCEIIQHDLTAIGLKVKIDQMASSLYRQHLMEGKLSIFRASWIADYPDPESYLSLLYSEYRCPKGPNYTRFATKQYDQLYQKAIQEPYMEKRIPLYRMMEKILLDEAPIIPLAYDQLIRFTSPDVEGLGVNPMNMLVLKRVRMKSSLK